jgi:hypothetical protein
LVFLDPQYRDRFRFVRTDDQIPETVRDRHEGDEDDLDRFTAPDGLWTIAYEEIGRDTMLGTGDGGSLRTSGRYWVDPMSGSVVLTEMVLTAPAVTAIVDVRYDVEPAVGLAVPVAMRERYRDRRNSRIDGAAEYSRVRRFQVSSTEEVAEPDAQ